MLFRCGFAIELAFEGGLVEEAANDGVMVLELDALGVGAGDLQGPEEESGLAVVLESAIYRRPEGLRHRFVLQGPCEDSNQLALCCREASARACATGFLQLNWS